MANQHDHPWSPVERAWAAQHPGYRPEIIDAFEKEFGRRPSRDSYGAMSKREAQKPTEVPSLGNTPNPLADSLHIALVNAKGQRTIAELADSLDVSPRRIHDALADLAKRGVNVDVKEGAELIREIPKGEPTRIDTRLFKGQTIKFGLTADNHLGSKYSRLDVLNALFDIWEDQGVELVYQLGNMVDGEARFNKTDLAVNPGMEAQVQYMIDNWPQRDGMVTQYITGDDHEGWYVRDYGVDFGRYLEYKAKEAKRSDLVYLGHMEHDIVLPGGSGSIMRLVHAGGGSAYATSYAVQKIVESYQGGEKPSVLLVGHYHKAEYGYPREVHVVQAACTQDQTPFLRKLKIQAHVGGWTVSFDVDDNGFVHGFNPQFHPFYDRSFYKKWSYHWKSEVA